MQNVDTDQDQAGFRIDQLREAERTIGRLEAERDQAAQERDALRAELTAAHESALQRGAEAVEVPDTTQRAWRRWWRRMTGGAVDLS